MREYVTIADVDSLLGMEWTDEDKKAEAVLKANLWLNERIDVDEDPVPSAIKLAGAQMAKLAAAGSLYGAQERETTSEEVSATSGTYVKESYSAGSKFVSASENFALALIRPWMNSIANVFMLKRI